MVESCAQALPDLAVIIDTNRIPEHLDLRSIVQLDDLRHDLPDRMRLEVGRQIADLQPRGRPGPAHGQAMFRGLEHARRNVVASEIFGDHALFFGTDAEERQDDKRVIGQRLIVLAQGSEREQPGFQFVPVASLETGSKELGQDGGVAPVVFPQFVETGPGFVVAIAGEQGAGKLLDRLHIVPRVVFDGLEKIRDGFVPLVHPRQGDAVILEHLGVAGLDFERASEAPDRFVPAHQRREDDAEIVVRFRVIGIALERITDDRQGFLETRLPDQGKAQRLQGQWMTRAAVEDTACRRFHFRIPERFDQAHQRQASRVQR